MKLDSTELAVIRELLSDAFNSGEIDTLAFDLFQPVYRDFSPAMTRSTKIRSIVEHANDSGRVRDLLAALAIAGCAQGSASLASHARSGCTGGLLTLAAILD